jgi:hypothetical protein
MATLPLYTANAVPDASHRVVGPGGYEWWHFDAESSSGDLHVVARLGAGFLFHPEYRQRYERYLRRPTSNPPPVAGDSPCIQFAVWRDGQRLARYAAHFPPDRFFASDREPQVRVGLSEFVREPDGLLRVRLRAVAGENSAGSSASIDLDFRPLLHHAPCEVSLARSPTGVPRHRWLLANPLCEVTAKIRCGGAAGEIEFQSTGYHDHAFGTEPLGLRSLRRVRGRILLEQRAIAFQLADSLNAQQPPEVWLVEVDVSGRRILQATQARCSWPAGVPSGNAEPDEIRLGTVDEQIILSDPRPLSSALASRWVSYSASVGKWIGRALCEVVDYPLKVSA